MQAYESRQGDAFAYATLLTALLRAADTPARVVAGYLIPADEAAVPHFWSEFFIQDAGWIPADPAMGDGLYPASADVGTDEPADFYFGNLDGQRVTFSRGLHSVPRLRPDGRIAAAPVSYALLSHNEEAVGNLESYRSIWYNVRVIGEFR